RPTRRSARPIRVPRTDSAPVKKSRRSGTIAGVFTRRLLHLPLPPASRPRCSTPSAGLPAQSSPGGGSGGGRRGPLRLISACQEMWRAEQRADRLRVRDLPAARAPDGLVEREVFDLQQLVGLEVLA